MKAFIGAGCDGLARVDFFVDGERVLVNELNTMPGFTPTSVYAKLMEASGVAYPRARRPSLPAGARAPRAAAALPLLSPRAYLNSVSSAIDADCMLGGSVVIQIGSSETRCPPGFSWMRSSSST